ncbi:uncharacterized protein ISCGN_030734 [Ixodes scapularis]
MNLPNLLLISLLWSHVAVVAPLVVRQQQQTSVREALQKLRRHVELQSVGDPVNPADPHQVEPPAAVDEETNDVDTLLRSRRQEREQAVMVQINVFNNDGKGYWHKKKKTPGAGRNRLTSTSPSEQESTTDDSPATTCQERDNDKIEEVAETTPTLIARSPCGGDSAQGMGVECAPQQEENQDESHSEPPPYLPRSDDQFDYHDEQLIPNQRPHGRMKALDEVLPDIHRRRARPYLAVLPEVSQKLGDHRAEAKPAGLFPFRLPDQAEADETSQRGNTRSPIVQKMLGVFMMRAPNVQSEPTTLCVCSTTPGTVTLKPAVPLFPWMAGRGVKELAGRRWSQRERFHLNRAPTYAPLPQETEATVPPPDYENYPVQENEGVQVRGSVGGATGGSYSRRGARSHAKSVARNPFSVAQLKAKPRSRIKRDIQQAVQPGQYGWCPCQPSPKPKCRKTTHKRKPCTKSRKPCTRSKKPCRKATTSCNESLSRGQGASHAPPANFLPLPPGQSQDQWSLAGRP